MMGDGMEFKFATPEEAMSSSDDRLVDLVDGLLDHGIVIRAELWLSVAEVDLVFLGADLVLSSPDKLRTEGARQ
jgi:hypothetical protein